MNNRETRESEEAANANGARGIFYEFLITFLCVNCVLCAFDERGEERATGEERFLLLPFEVCFRFQLLRAKVPQSFIHFYTERQLLAVR